MFINKEELERRRKEGNNLIQRISVKNDREVTGPIAELDTTKFRNDGTPCDRPRLDGDLRAIVAATAMIAGPKAAAEIGGVSESYAAVLGRGDFARQDTINPEERERRNQELRDRIYDGLGKIRDVAQIKLLKVLKLINNENLEAIAPKDRARLAAQMANQLSGIVDRTINKGEHGGVNNSAHLHLYAPERRPLEAFTIKTVNPISEESKSNGISSAE